MSESVNVDSGIRRSRRRARSAAIAVAAAMVISVVGGTTQIAVAKPAKLTPAERANSGVVTYDQIGEDFGACEGSAGSGISQFEHRFTGTKSLKITSLDVEDDEGNTYSRKKKNVWTRRADDGTRVTVTFRRDGMTLRSFNPDGSPCITYTRTLVEPAG